MSSSARRARRLLVICVKFFFEKKIFEQSDPELPDYILLLLTNRKPKREMIDELNVFLPKSKTASLVDWLFGEIEALKSKRRVPVVQSANKESSSPKSKKKERKRDRDDRDRKKKKKDRRERTREVLQFLKYFFNFFSLKKAQPNYCNRAKFGEWQGRRRRCRAAARYPWSSRAGKIARRAD